MSSFAEDETGQQPKELVIKITKWFQEEGYVTDPIADNESYYHAIFHHKIQKTPRIIIDIPKDSHDKIKVGTTFGYRLLEKPSDFLSDTKDANRYNVAFQDALESLKMAYHIRAAVEDVEIEIVKTISIDGLSKHVLFEAKREVLAAYNVLDLIHQRLSQESDG